jgi:hypothetical protein
MAKFPEPPDTLALPAEIKTLPIGTDLWRVYFVGGRHPAEWNGFRRFGPTTSRFDHHDPPPSLQKKGVLYAAAEAITCLAEVFQAVRVIDRNAGQPWLVGFRIVRELSLLDLTSSWPTRAGASMAINTGPRPRAQRWSQLIYATYPGVDGIYYPSSMHANSPSLTLFERAQSSLPTGPMFNRALADPTLLRRIGAAAQRLGYKLV